MYSDITAEKLQAGFITLFRGRADVYGHDEGRCVKEPLDTSVFNQHLTGGNSIGVYPIVPTQGDFKVVWGCSDIDIEDIVRATNLRDALKEAGVTSYVERSRSKGYHVWVFAPELVHAKDMRRMFLAAHQVADIPPIEVNPKQETLNGTNYGNYVRLPYPNGLNEMPTRRVILDRNNQPVPMDIFIPYALEHRTDPTLITKLAGYYTEPVYQHTAPLQMDTPTSVRDALTNLSPLGKVIWRDGPLPSKDRSTTLSHLGHECVRSGLNPSETRTVIADADRRWGKYHLRTNGDMEIDKLVMRVFR